MAKTNKLVWIKVLVEKNIKVNNKCIFLAGMELYATSKGDTVVLVQEKTKIIIKVTKDEAKAHLKYIKDTNGKYITKIAK